MKIAFIVNNFPSISQTFILSQITGLIDRGHDVYIFAKSKKKEVIHSDVERYQLIERTNYYLPQKRFHRLSKSSVSFFRFFFKHPFSTLKSIIILRPQKNMFAKLFCLGSDLMGKNFDIIHCQFGLLGVMVIHLKRMKCLKGDMVTSFRGYDMAEENFNKHAQEYSVIFQESSAILPVCNYFKSILIKKGCNPDKITVHPSGTNLSLFQCRTTKANKEVLNIITVGRLVERKGVQYAIRAVAETIKSLPEIKINYSIIGDGIKRKELEELAKELGIANQISFLGWQSHNEVRNTIQKSDLLLFTGVSNPKKGYDGIPGVIREAMACCLPILATNTGGVPEIVENNRSGFVVAEKDLEALTEKLKELIKNPKKREEMGKEGRKIVKEKFDIERLNDKLVEIYKKCLESNEPK